MADGKRVSTPYTYSSAVVAGDTVYLGLHRGFGDTFSEQLADVLDSLRDTLGELGLALEDLVKVNVWLKHIEDLPAMEQGFRDYFDEGEFPARMTSTTAFIDADCLLMIDGVAYKGT